MRTVVLATAIGISAVGLSIAADSQAAIRRHTDIPAQALRPALHTLSKDCDIQLVFRTDVVGDVRTDGAVGELTVTEALTQLLSGTGLTYRYLDEETVTIVPVVAASGEGATRVAPDEGQSPSSQVGEATSAAGGRKKSFWQRLRLAQVETSSGSEEDRTSVRSSENSQKRIELEEILVTGSRIKGVRDQFSPVIQITREQMELAGQTSVASVFESLPQNFANVSPDTVAAADARGPGAAGINLHGLGAEATLTLLNGRRLPGGGQAGTFVDVSTIPTAAIERIEVLTDGASAIYGSEAIAGVVNIILRDDFEGAESRLNVSTLTDGGGQALNFGQSVGFHGERVHGLAVYEYSSDEELDVNDKDFVKERRPGLLDPSYLLPLVRKHSFFASGGAELSERVSVSADGYYNRRKSEAYRTTGTAAAPQIALHEPEVEQFGGSATFTAQLFSDWEGDLSGTYARGEYNSRTSRLDTNPGGSFPSRLNNAYRLWSADASISGSLFHLGGAAVRSVLGTHYRSELLDFDQLFGTLPPVVRTDERKVFAAYGEFYVPILDRLALTAAARYDDYSDAGSSFNPKVGLAWSPVAGLNLRGTWGKSFRPPFMFEFIPSTSTNLGIYIDPQSPTGFSPALQVIGRRGDLGPERAESWTAGFDLEPERLKGLRLRATYFNVDYTDRLGSPAVSFDSVSRFRDFTGTPIRGVSAELAQSLVNESVLFQDLSLLSTPITLSQVTVLLDTRIQNISASRLRGVDLEMSYQRRSNYGDWSFALNATHLMRLEQQVTPLTAASTRLDTFGNPVDWKVRGSTSWRTARATVALFVNYVDGYTDTLALGGPVPIDAWTTLDMSVRLELGDLFHTELARDSALTLSVINLLDEDPPNIGPRAPTNSTTFDSSNANPAGRSVGLLLTKQW